MTPSQEKQMMRDVKALIAANEALDKKQGEDIAALKKKVKALENRVMSAYSGAAKKSSA